jgi:hypothetical protein
MPVADRPPRSDQHTSPLRRNGFVLAGAFLVLVLTLAAAVVMTGGTSHPAPPQAHPSSSAPQTQAASAGCRPTDTNQQIPSAPPPGLTWQVYNTIAFPFSVTAGPMVVEKEGVARCYAHTPLGALLAVSHIGYRMMWASDWRKVAAAQVLPSAGRDVYVRRRAEVPEPLDFRPGELAQIAGFQFVAYTQTTAVVQLVTRGPEGSMRSLTFTVMWQDGDWKLQVQPSGDASPNAQDISSLDGFVAWGGV